ncbi:hypothetical protein [uncultured Oscillibacter sp.]|uniref:hypothetical protein n=1 Tax=uncultured Oscillibacter sp. TaxID=876091 RepID=UPI00262E9302|nr:hypothetical protein [uncultured Oscillibacter sp.]
MMKMSFEVTAKKLFGVKYERLIRTLFLELVAFWGLHISGFRVEIAPLILYLMTVAFSAGVMWQALSSDGNRANMENMFMLPFEGRTLVFSYVAALGAYTLLTKTAGLLAVVWAVGHWSWAEIMGSILCALAAIVTAACLYPLRLGRMDAYAFYVRPASYRRTVKVRRRSSSVWRYLFRYLMAHKNYLVNTAAMWGVACVLPVLLGQMEARFVLPIGFAILSLNTPICILLSCDPALERAVRFLPGQGRAFCVPYCLFIFGCNLAADIVFLCSWQIQLGGIGPLHALTAAAFALLSAVGSVLLEWYFPLRGWKIESDLWHHPRKYVVPAVMLLLTGLVSMI